jgi:hypothetical protein
MTAATAYANATAVFIRRTPFPIMLFAFVPDTGGCLSAARFQRWIREY